MSKYPTNLFSRLVRIPNSGGNGRVDETKVHFVYLEEIIAAHLDMLFSGLEVIASFPFRITRDADLEIEVDEASDLPDYGRRDHGAACTGKTSAHRT